MPELPEVETIRRELAKEIIGKKLAGVEVVKVRRRAKILIIDFANGESLVFHLKLTGQLLLNAKPNKYTRAIFNFDDGTTLLFNDVRKFGWWKRVKDVSLIEKELGPEPLDKDFTLSKFKEMLGRRGKARIKPLLMDQRFIAGIGNIYSDEILFKAGIHPLARAGDLNSAAVAKLFSAIKEILKKAVEKRGSSIEQYLDLYGRKGDYVAYHHVYQQKKCPSGHQIEKIKIGGRSAYFCPRCQKI